VFHGGRHDIGFILSEFLGIAVSFSTVIIVLQYGSNSITVDWVLWSVVNDRGHPALLLLCCSWAPKCWLAVLTIFRLVFHKG